MIYFLEINKKLVKINNICMNNQKKNRNKTKNLKMII